MPDSTDDDSNGNLIEVERNATPADEYQDFGNPATRRAQLQNEDLAGDIEEKKKFAWHAYRLAWTWLGFLLVVTWLQAVPDWFNFKLDDWAFRILFTSVTAAVFGFAYLIGKYLFPSSGRKSG